MSSSPERGLSILFVPYAKEDIESCTVPTENKNKGLGEFMPEIQTKGGGGLNNVEAKFGSIKAKARNFHPTVKPISLFKYLITMESRNGELVLDPFMGSGTTAIACEETNRNWIGIEKDEEYVEIIKARLKQYMQQNKLDTFI